MAPKLKPKPQNKNILQTTLNFFMPRPNESEKQIAPPEPEPLKRSPDRARKTTKSETAAAMEVDEDVAPVKQESRRPTTPPPPPAPADDDAVERVSTRLRRVSVMPKPATPATPKRTLRKRGATAVSPQKSEVFSPATSDTLAGTKNDGDDDGEGDDAANSDSDDDLAAGNFRAARASNRALIERSMKAIEPAARIAAAKAASRPVAAPRGRTRSGLAAAPRTRTRAEPKKAAAPQTRMSARLAGIDARIAAGGEAGEGAVPATRGAKRLIDELQQAETGAKKRKVGDLSLEGDGVEGLKGLAVMDTRGVKTFTEEDIKKTTSKELRELREGLGKLQLYRSWEPNKIKITPQRTYTMMFHPTTDKAVLFAGDKEGHVSVFDSSQPGPKYGWDDEEPDEDEEYDEPHQTPIVHTFQPHVRPVSSLAQPYSSPNAVLSGSYDASIRLLDLTKLTSTVVYEPSDDAGATGRGDGTGISALDVHSEDAQLAWFSTLAGDLGVVDMRLAPSHSAVRSWRVGSTKVGGFSLHPLRAHLAVTASNDRTTRVWDLRASVKGWLDPDGTEPSERSTSPGQLATHESKYTVIHAAWSASGVVATTCYDDHVRLFRLGNAKTSGWTYIPAARAKEPPEPEQLADPVMIPHSCQTGRWVTQIKPVWQRRPADGAQKLVVGSMDRLVDVFDDSGERLAQLGGEEERSSGRALITAVPAAAAIHPEMNWIAGGNASGKLTLWM